MPQMTKKKQEQKMRIKKIKDMAQKDGTYPA